MKKTVHGKAINKSRGPILDKSAYHPYPTSEPSSPVTTTPVSTTEKPIIVSDTTLRDGHQQPGLAFTLDERLYIAGMLKDLGVDVIEAGFPANSLDADPVYKIAQSVRGPKISALARVTKGDIDIAYESLKPAVDRGDGMVHVFIGTSEMHRTHSHRKNAEEVQTRVAEMIGYAKNLFGDVQFSPEDATRTGPEYLDLIIKTAIEAGAGRINIPDTVGYSLPFEFEGMIKRIVQTHEAIRNGDVILSVHCHNDLDNAVMNTLTGIYAGATQFEGTINGIGERAGNTDLASVVMGLRTREDLFIKLSNDGHHDTAHINAEKFSYVSSEVDRIAEMPAYPNRPVTGTNAFRDSSGIHAAAVMRNPGTYHIMRAEDVGGEIDIVVGPTSGTNITKSITDKFGYEATDAQVEEMTELLKTEAVKSKAAFYENETHVFVKRYLGLSPKDDPIELRSWNVSTGTSVTNPVAEVELYVNGERREAYGEGTGPIDAVSKSILSALNGSLAEEIKLVKFDEIPVSGGTEAIARAQVALEHRGQKYWGRDRSPDIVKAGINAIMNAINSIYVLNPPETYR